MELFFGGGVFCLVVFFSFLLLDAILHALILYFAKSVI